MEWQDTIHAMRLASEQAKRNTTPFQFEHVGNNPQVLTQLAYQTKMFMYTSRPTEIGSGSIIETISDGIDNGEAYVLGERMKLQ